MDAFDKEVVRRLPLATATLAVLNYVLNEPFLDRVYASGRGRGYQRLLKFALLVALVRDALLVHQGHGLPSFENAAESGELPVLCRSVYPKLARMATGVSTALLRESSLKMLPLIEPASTSIVPKSVGDLQVITLDGKTLKHVRHQLKPLRPLRGRLLGGKLLVAQDLASGIALAMGADEDGEANEVRLADAVIDQVQSMSDVLTKPRLWMGDRQYCDLRLMERFVQDGGHFLIRMNQTLGFVADPSRPAQYGADGDGRPFTTEWGWVGGEKHPRRRYVRKITLQREGEEDVILLSDLLDSLAYPALDLLGVYLLRWGIEQMFQVATEVFCLRQLIGCTPRATIFQAAFCFVIYNAILVMRSYVAAAGQVTPQEVSTAKFFDDVQEELIAHGKLVPMQSLIESSEPVKTEAQVKRMLSDLLSSRWRPRWLKARSNPRRTRGRTQHVKGGKTSVFKALQRHRAAPSAVLKVTKQRR